MTTDKHSKLVIEQTLGEKLETWYEKNNKWLTMVLVIVVAGYVGYRLYDWMHAKDVAKANAAYGAALQRFDLAAQAQDPKQKTDQLQGAITAATQVVSDYGDKFVGRQAQLMIGNAQYQLANDQPGEAGVANLEKARESFQKYLSMTSDPMEQAAGKIALGNVLENLSFIRNDDKAFDEALTAYRDAAKSADGTYLGAEANITLARALATSKNSERQDEAKKLLESVVKSREVADGAKNDSESKPVELTSGQTLSPEQIASIKNQTAWSQQQLASDELKSLN